MAFLWVFAACCFLSFFCESREWVGTWTCGLHGGNPKVKLTHTTLRQIVRVSIGGSTVRVSFSNVYSDQSVTILSAAIAVSNGGSAIKVNSQRLLMFNGSKNVTMPPKSEVYSDPVNFPLKKSSLLAITIFFGKTPLFITGHFFSLTNSYLCRGFHVTDARFSKRKSKKVEKWVVIKGVEVDAIKTSQSEAAKSTHSILSETATTTGVSTAATVVALGDSITDGAWAGIDKHNRWTDILSMRLLGNSSTEHIGLLNVGINGNSILSMPVVESRGGGRNRHLRALTHFGVAARERFERDVLAQPKVRWLIVAEGVNDLGFAYQPFRNMWREKMKQKAAAKKKRAHEKRNNAAGEGKTGEEEKDRNEKKEARKKMKAVSAVVPKLISAYNTMINRAHAQGIRVIGCTLLPVGRSKWGAPCVVDAVNTVNAWIRESKKFDAVVDFHAVMKSESNSDVMEKELHCGDYMHPSEAGHVKMGEAFDLRLFLLYNI